MFSHVVWICNISYIYVDLFHAPYRIACLIICVKVKEDELGRTCRILNRPLPRRRRWSSTRQNLTPTRADFNVTKRDFPPTASTVYIQTEPLPWPCRATNSPDFCRSIFSVFTSSRHSPSWNSLQWQFTSLPELTSAKFLTRKFSTSSAIEGWSGRMLSSKYEASLLSRASTRTPS